MKDSLNNLKNNDNITQKILDIFYGYANLLLNKGAYYKEGFKDVL